MFKLIRRAVLPAALVITSLLFASPAGAQTVEDCQALIGDLQAATASAGFTNAKDEAAAAAKLTAAGDKLAEGKADDAILKLTDFQLQVQKLAAAPKPKLDADAANGLVTGADAAISCIQGLDG